MHPEQQDLIFNKPRRQQYPIPDLYSKLDHISNLDKNSMQNKNYSSPKQNSTIADIYYRKYRNLSNQLPMRQNIATYPVQDIQANNTISYNAYGHISQRSDFSQGSFITNRPNNYQHQNDNNFPQPYVTNLQEQILNQKMNNNIYPTNSPIYKTQEATSTIQSNQGRTADILYLEKIDKSSFNTKQNTKKEIQNEKNKSTDSKNTMNTTNDSVNNKNPPNTAKNETTNKPINKNIPNEAKNEGTKKLSNNKNTQNVTKNEVTNQKNNQNVTKNNKKSENKNGQNNSKTVSKQNDVSDIQKQADLPTKKEDNVNKNVKKATRGGNTNKDVNKNQKTEIIFQNNDTNFSPSNEDLEENPSIQKVTQDLKDIIYNLKKQIQNVEVTKPSPMEEIPSALIQTKEKEFFKKSNATAKPKQTPKPQTQKPTQSQKPAQNQKPPSSKPNSNQSSKVSIKISNSRFGSSSLYSRTSLLSKSSNTSNRRFTSVTAPNLLSSSFFGNKSSFIIDPLKILKDEVQQAIRAHKTFTVRGNFYSVRKALRERGWVEKFHSTYPNTLNEDLKRYFHYTVSELVPLLRKSELAELAKNLIKSKLLGSYQVDFYWSVNNDAFKENPDKIKFTIINKLKRDIFSYTTKQGLCDASKTAYWFQKRNVSKLNHPRSYTLVEKGGDLRGFIEDFRNTATMSLLKWIIKTSVTKESKLLSPSGKIPLEVFDFAMNECCKFIKKEKHEDIDTTIPEATEQEWNTFLDYFYKIVHYSNHFTQEDRESEESMVRKSNYAINTLKEVWPYVDMDGMMNIWILKPVASSRGRGIHMCRTLEYVLKVLKNNQNIRYVIQKYIERPLLIHSTKFDIRQWFLISNCSPLTIWMYKDCYLRFSSQTYNLRKLHESIHLTNNSVQCKYKNNSVDAALPSYNMWDLEQFKTYLGNIGYPNVFKDTIYPGMKQCITAAVLMHQDKMIIRKNCFELYGADFILTEDFQPWLLEINSNPALYNSTPVTARLCPKVLEDVIKVIVDYGRNVKASTGGFELIYKEQILKLPAPASLEIKGVPLTKDYFNPELDEKSSLQVNQWAKSVTNHNNQKSFQSFTEEIKKTLTHLLQIIHEERRKRDWKPYKEKCGLPLAANADKNQIKT